jgi:hypothetical protein
MQTHTPSRTVALMIALVATATAPLAAQDSTDTGLSQAGYGRLNQDDLSFGMRTESLDIRFTILEESGLRLLNQDSYNSLHRLVQSKRAQIDSVAAAFGISTPGILMVRYFSLAEGTRFDAQLLTANINARFWTPLGIVPLSSSIHKDRLGRREQASGIYVFDEPLTPFVPMAFTYGTTTANAWNSSRVETLQRERARIQSRATARELPDND